MSAPDRLPRRAWPEGSLRGLAQALSNAALAAARRTRRERRIAADARYLKAFDDRILADIGLTRADIDTFVRHRATRLEGAPGRSEEAAGFAAALLPLPCLYDRS